MFIILWAIFHVLSHNFWVNPHPPTILKLYPILYGSENIQRYLEQNKDNVYEQYISRAIALNTNMIKISNLHASNS